MLSFYEEFSTRIRRIYENHTPGYLRHDVDCDCRSQFLNFTFNISHPRGDDDVFIRLVGIGDFALDLHPGLGADAFCMADKFGVRWIPLSGESSLTEPEKVQIERILQAMYAACETKREVLAMLLKEFPVQRRSCTQVEEVDSSFEWS